MSDTRLYGGIEAGGTKFICAVGSGPDDIRAQTRFATTQPAENIDQCLQFFDEQSRRHGPVAAVHDRGAPMTSKCTAQLLADLGITRSLSRPQVSDDNPFSEAQFKTLKYHPGFPARFADQDDATGFCRTFFPWYNTEHRHGGIALLTPDDVHHGRAEAVLAQRQRTLEMACAAHPERFVRGTPVLPEPATAPSTKRVLEFPYTTSATFVQSS